MPLAVIAPSASTSKKSRTARYVRSERSTLPGAASCCILAARLTVSPTAVKSMVRSSLIVPTTTGPVLSPTRKRHSTPCRPLSSSEQPCRDRCISRAAETAWRAEFSWAMGAPKIAMPPSPAKWATCPS